jgi:hypothetical protein
MRAIKQAFAAQGIDVAWRGPEPDNVEDLTADYLAEDVDGLPRMRPADAVIDFAQLQTDYAAALAKAQVPAAVTARQARLALLQAGLLSSFVAAMDAMAGPEGEAARIEWEYALGIERESPLVLALASQLGLTESQVDALFVAAKVL